jgi:asparagine synthase (glutamine-hydrolysing)
MCGICGIVGHVDPDVLDIMTNTMAHRGPDDRGLHCGERIGLGARRLSIIDVTGGHQPIANEEGTLVVVYNGEIYNHRELRARLEVQGHRFSTRSDTEVLLHLHEEYGDAAVHLLQGMFAYAVWGRERRRLVLVRDRLGIKPLYYTETNGSMLFASEVKALLEHPDVKTTVDHTALELYLAFRYVPGPDTLFKGIKKLQPGHFLVHENGRTEIRRYWEPVLGDFLPGTRLDEAVEEFAELLQQTVRSQLVSDVPVGMLLSGGIDSSAIAAMMARATDRPITTFTVGFDLPGAHNELDHARAVARHLGADHHELVLSPNAAELLPDLVRHMDEPVADPALLPTYLICRFAHEKVPVVLTGEGGDELLGGYPRYEWFARAGRLKRGLPAWFRERVLLSLGRIAPLSHRYHTALDNLLADRNDVARHLHWVAGLDPALRSELLAPDFRATVTTGAAEALLEPYLGPAATSAELVHRLMALDMRTWLVDDVLTKMDKMSMAASVEARVPFLDHRLVEFVTGVPLAVKLALGPKTLLRRAATPLLPTATVRRRKHAFQIPLDPWLGGPLAGFVREILLDDRARQRAWFDVRRIEALLTHMGDDRAADAQSVWTLLCLELWAREFLDGNGRPRVIARKPGFPSQPAGSK